MEIILIGMMDKSILRKSLKNAFKTTVYEKLHYFTILVRQNNVQ